MELTASRPVPRVPGHPIFGHLRSFRSDREGMLLHVAKSHPDAAHLPMGFVSRLMGPVVIVGSPSMANEILTTKQASFVKSYGLSLFLKPLLGSGLLTSEGQAHTRQRKLLAPAFMHKRVSSYAETMVTRTERHVAALSDGQTLDVADAMMKLTFEIVGKTLFDAELLEDAPEIGHGVTVSMEVAMDQIGSYVPFPPAIPSPSNLRYKRAVEKLDAIVYRVIRERRDKGGDHGDVLSILLDARDEDGTAMTDRQIRDESMTLFLAGHETTANALAWTFDLLSRNPDVRRRVEDEVDALDRSPTFEDLKRLPYTLAVFKEAMRLRPPVYMLGRRALEDVDVGGLRIEKNSIVMINILGIHRRGDLWSSPEAFDPERFLGDKEKQLPRCAYLPFGGGPRVCIGNHFALMEGHALLATIARQVRFDAEDSRPVVAEPLITLRPKGGLPMRVTRRAGRARSQ